MHNLKNIDVASRKLIESIVKILFLTIPYLILSANNTQNWFSTKFRDRMVI